MLFDDSFGLNLDPTWYEGWKLLGKREGLVVDHSILPAMDEKASGKAKYPFMQLEEAPYWNFQPDNYETHEVWELEGTPKNNHLVSRRHMFVGATLGAPKFYWQDHYDRKGEHWHVEFVGYKDWKWDDGRNGTDGERRGAGGRAAPARHGVRLLRPVFTSIRPTPSQPTTLPRRCRE